MSCRFIIIFKTKTLNKTRYILVLLGCWKKSAKTQPLYRTHSPSHWQRAVHKKPALKHLQLPVQPFLHLQWTSSLHISVNSGIVIQVGTNRSWSFFHPRDLDSYIFPLCFCSFENSEFFLKRFRQLKHCQFYMYTLFAVIHFYTRLHFSSSHIYLLFLICTLRH